MRESRLQQGSVEASGDGRTILVSANSSWNIVNFRSGLIRSLQAGGYRVVVAAPQDEHSPKLAGLGATFVPIAVNSSGLSVIEDLRLLADYVKIFRKVRPFAFLGFTAKPNIYGSLAARSVRAKVINNISGLGTAFIKKSPLTWLVSHLYRLSLRRSVTVFFQNRDDLDLFTRAGIVRAGQARLLPGSGVDLERFKPLAKQRRDGPVRFLFVARLLWDKGVGEYVEAARIVRALHPEAVFQLLGPAGANNRTAVPSDELERWRGEGVIDYLGATDDVRAAMEQADCVVLPSYREGLPRALLEGSAMGKPLIATDVPGCREVVIDGQTGYLCEVRSVRSLADAMLKMIDASDSERSAMGARGRAKVEQEFCESRAISRYLEALAAG